ncbi:MAG: hypothetical protein JWQ49_3928 [Edaphobacter sp.]|nr:hypothetical protein [Edaphobacter sp.]
MMSAAISMMAGVEQTKVSPATGDLFSGQGELGNFSFAKSFNESVGVPASSQGKNAVDDLAAVLPGLKDTTPTKILEEVAEKSSGVKENSIGAQEMPPNGELKGTVAGRIVPQQGTPVSGSQENITANDAGTKKAEFPAQVEGTTDDVSSVADAAASGTTIETPQPHDGTRPLPSVLSGGSPVVQRRTETAEKVGEGVSSRKLVKAQESSSGQKTVQKTARKLGDAVALEPKPVAVISTEGATPVVGQVVAPTAALQGAISNKTDVSGKVASSATNPANGTSPITVSGQARLDIASGANPGVADRAMTVTAGSDPVATLKTDISPLRISAVTMAGVSDGENKAQAPRESGTALFHSTGIVPTAGVSSNTPGELAPIKMLAGDAGSHMAGLPAGSAEQDGAGVFPQSMDGVPRMLGATPTSLEVGIQNGTHGWLKVRAEMVDGGVVNASVSAGSSAGQEMLHRELPALTAYLQEEKVAVNAVTVHAPSAAGSDARSSSGTDGAGGQTPQRSDDGERQGQSPTLNGSDETVSYRSSHGVDENGSLPLAVYANGGNWLSVRA